MKNIGLVDSLNKGSNTVVDSYIARMDADDISCKIELKNNGTCKKRCADIVEQYSKHFKEN